MKGVFISLPPNAGHEVILAPGTETTATAVPAGEYQMTLPLKFVATHIGPFTTAARPPAGPLRTSRTSPFSKHQSLPTLFYLSRSIVLAHQRPRPSIPPGRIVCLPSYVALRRGDCVHGPVLDVEEHAIRPSTEGLSPSSDRDRSHSSAVCSIIFASAGRAPELIVSFSICKTKMCLGHLQATQDHSSYVERASIADQHREIAGDGGGLGTTVLGAGDSVPVGRCFVYYPRRSRGLE